MTTVGGRAGRRSKRGAARADQSFNEPRRCTDNAKGNWNVKSTESTGIRKQLFKRRPGRNSQQTVSRARWANPSKINQIAKAQGRRTNLITVRTKSRKEDAPNTRIEGPTNEIPTHNQPTPTINTGREDYTNINTRIGGPNPRNHKARA